MDSEVAERIKELKDHFEVRHRELKEHLEKHYATRVDLLTFREDVAIQFGKVHVEIARLEATLIRWFIATAVTIAGATFGIARYFH